MATPLRSFHSSISSSSSIGTRLRRKATTIDRRRAQCWVSSSGSTLVSETRPIVTATAASYGPTLSTAAGRTAAVLGRGSTKPPRGALRLSSAAAPLFGDTIIITKRCAEVMVMTTNTTSFTIHTSSTTLLYRTTRMSCCCTLVFIFFKHRTLLFLCTVPILTVLDLLWRTAYTCSLPFVHCCNSCTIIYYAQKVVQPISGCVFAFVFRSISPPKRAVRCTKL